MNVNFSAFQAKKGILIARVQSSIEPVSFYEINFICIILCASSYLTLSCTDKDKLNALICTDMLLKQEIHNTVQELIDALRQLRYLHLAGSDTGRHTVLDSFGIRIPAHTAISLAPSPHGHRTCCQTSSQEHAHRIPQILPRSTSSNSS